jgi:hypothetical protein
MVFCKINLITKLFIILMLSLSFAQIFDMKRRAYILLIVVILAIIGYWLNAIHNGSIGTGGPKQEAIKIRKHSAEFNNGIDTLLSAYLFLKDALVKNDTSNAKIGCADMITISDTMHLEELKKDTVGVFSTAQMVVGIIRGNAQSLLQEKDIAGMRTDFKMISEYLYPLLKAIHYDGNNLYWQNCPMAFGDGNDASWISTSAAIENPYKGNADASMEHCGETKDSIVAK